jgi:hypothetical protein
MTFKINGTNWRKFNYINEDLKKVVAEVTEIMGKKMMSFKLKEILSAEKMIEKYQNTKNTKNSKENQLIHSTPKKDC